MLGECWGTVGGVGCGVSIKNWEVVDDLNYLQITHKTQYWICIPNFLFGWGGVSELGWIGVDWVGGMCCVVWMAGMAELI